MKHRKAAGPVLESAAILTLLGCRQSSFQQELQDQLTEGSFLEGSLRFSSKQIIFSSVDNFNEKNFLKSYRALEELEEI